MKSCVAGWLACRCSAGCAPFTSRWASRYRTDISFEPGVIIPKVWPSKKCEGWIEGTLKAKVVQVQGYFVELWD